MAKIKIDIDTEATERKITHEVHVSAQPKIAVISSISIPNPLRDAFSRGVNINGADIKYSEKRGYKKGDHQNLSSEIGRFNSIANVIVVAGGLAAFEAAEADATKPFLSLTGIVPPSSNGNFRGGISLESVGSNRDRIEILKSKGPILSELGLFCNANSSMTQQEEIDDWNYQVGTKDTQVFFGGNDNQHNNSSNAYASDFTLAKIPATIKALVISADPFFQDTKGPLVAAVNTWIAAEPAGVNRYVCYPSLAFAQSTNPPTQGRSILYGPDLVTAYSLLGQFAAIAVNSSGPMVTLRLTNIRQDL